jgi:hypothetical protein
MNNKNLSSNQRTSNGISKERKLTNEAHETWLNKKWRPAMGWMYMVVCIADFIIFPIAWAIFQSYIGANPVIPHEPFTLQGAGLFHMAMGAVLGIAAWSRGKEKMAGVAGVSDYDYEDRDRRISNRHSSREREYETYYSSPARKGPPPADEPLI